VYEKSGCARIAVHPVVTPRVIEIPRYAEFVVDPKGGSQPVAVAHFALILYGRKTQTKI
jgi:hypothetical protein